MSASMETMPPNGHESFLVKIFQKLKTTFTRAEEIAYADYQQLTPQQVQEDIVRFCDDYPIDNNGIWFDPNTGYINLTVNESFDPSTGLILF